MPDEKRIGKYVSMILRHHPEVAGITLDEHGWAEIDELIRKSNYPLSEELLHRLAFGKDKQRYEFSDDGRYIRAVHGHSVEIDLGYQEQKPPEILYHGSAQKSKESIEEKGLLKMTRQYVHLSETVEQAREVGQRHGKLLLYSVRTGEMHLEGYTFYRSTSGVWLTDHVPFKFLEEI